MSTYETIKAESIKRIIGGISFLILLLAGTLWLLIPRTFWIGIDSWMPKRGLWALLGLMMILTIFSFSYIIFKRSQRMTLGRQLKPQSDSSNLTQNEILIMQQIALDGGTDEKNLWYAFQMRSAIAQLNFNDLEKRNLIRARTPGFYSFTDDGTQFAIDNNLFKSMNS